MKRVLLLALLILQPLGLVAEEKGKVLDPIKAESSLLIRVKGIPAAEIAAIDGAYVISKAGKLYMPMLNGGISVKGLTFEQAAKKVEKAYKEAGIYTDLRVEIREGGRICVTGFGSGSVAVAGSVRRLGPVSFTEGMTLQQAIDAAGGATKEGAIQRVQLVRKGKQLIYDLREPKVQNLRLQVRDVITVPERQSIEAN